MQYTKELFHDTVGILVRAYMNDTLRHGDCAACAVGNIVAHRMGLSIVPDPEYVEEPQPFMMWSNGEYPNKGWYQVTRAKSGYSENAMRQILASGYRPAHLRLIEYRFEKADPGRSSDQWMFNGLMAVVDVLCEIHGMNETEKQESKALFVKA